MLAVFTDYFLAFTTLVVRRLHCAYLLAKVANLLDVNFFLFWLIIIVVDELSDCAVMGRYLHEVFEMWVGR